MLDDFFGRLEAAGIAAAVEAWSRAAATVASRAQELAPVRKVFKGQGAQVRTRLKTMAEIETDRPIRQRLNLGPENFYLNPPSTVTHRAPQLLRFRTVVGPGMLANPRAQANLDRRGRYELKSGRSVHEGQLGGRLRSEIYAAPAQIDGHVISARVVSPTPYAKYMEFGTRHAAAHPYLRPAMHDSLTAIRADVARSVASAASHAAGSVRVNVVWKLKAVA